MKIILSRKGFDSSAGGKPSPILPDGRLISLPIPDSQSTIRYRDIQWPEGHLGTWVSTLTGNRVRSTHKAHLDPDLIASSLPREPGWQPLFGQMGSAQGHLRRCGIAVGDLFLFFGLFQPVIRNGRRWQWQPGAPRRHVLWGWMQIGEIRRVDQCSSSDYSWAQYHPHFRYAANNSNTLYIAAEKLNLPEAPELPGAGVFSHFSPALTLTAADARTPSQWRLPDWCYPRGEQFPFTYHHNPGRWQRAQTGTRLQAVARGQEFVLDTQYFPEALGWAGELIKGA